MKVLATATTCVVAAGIVGVEALKVKSKNDFGFGDGDSFPGVCKVNNIPDAQKAYVTSLHTALQHGGANRVKYSLHTALQHGGANRVKYSLHIALQRGGANRVYVILFLPTRTTRTSNTEKKNIFSGV